MLTLRFDSPSQLILGPASAFTFDGPLILQSPHDRIVCRFAQQAWHLDDERAHSFDCTGRSCIELEDSQGRTSPVYGPFRQLQFRAENCIADGRPFAELIAHRPEWKHCDSGIRWRLLCLKPARTA